MTAALQAQRLARIAHELRGPAGVAQGAARELVARAGSDTTAPFAQMLDRGVDRILRIADRLSRMSSITLGHAQMQPLVSEIGASVVSAVQASEALEAKQNIAVRVNQPKPIMASFDAGWFEFAVRELLSNAIQHARHLVEVSVVADDETVWVEIDDDGPGFRETVDFSLEAAPNPRRGVGLSLPMVHFVVTQGHQGQMTTENLEKGGARVRLSFPATPMPKTAEEAEEGAKDES